MSDNTGARYPVPETLFTKSDCAIDNCDYDLSRDEHIKNRVTL